MSASFLRCAHQHGVRMALGRSIVAHKASKGSALPLVRHQHHRRRSMVMPSTTSTSSTKLFSVPASSSPSSSLPPQLQSLLDREASDPFEPPYDAIMVLGGGIETRDGTLPPWVLRRLDAAAALREACCSSPNCSTPPPKIVLLGAGTPHKPPPKDGDTGRALTEAKAAARYLLSLKPSSSSPSSPLLSPFDILKEEASFDTVGNALFGLTAHALPGGWVRLAVVTSDFHMPRARAIFEKTFGLASSGFRSTEKKSGCSSFSSRKGAASVLAPGAKRSSERREGEGGGSSRSTSSPSPHLLPPFELSFLATNDSEDLLPADVSEARAAREAASTARWISDTQNIKTLRELHAWIHAEHLCYATAKQELFGVPEAANKGMDPKALATY